MVDGLKLSKPNDEMLCRICLEAKQSRLPFKGERTRASRPIELIHSDICGQINTPTWNGKKYFITLIDDFTHFTVIYLLTNKSKTFEVFKEYIATVEAQFSTKVSRLRYDNSGENTSNDIKQFCIQIGIQTKLIISYTPEQNGHAERMNRTLIDKVRALLLQSSLDKEMSGEAVLTATYLINRSLSTSTFNKTSAELWFKRRQNISNLNFLVLLRICICQNK